MSILSSPMWWTKLCGWQESMRLVSDITCHITSIIWFTGNASRVTFFSFFDRPFWFTGSHFTAEWTLLEGTNWWTIYVSWTSFDNEVVQNIWMLSHKVAGFMFDYIYILTMTFEVFAVSPGDEIISVLYIYVVVFVTK